MFSFFRRDHVDASALLTSRLYDNNIFYNTHANKGRIDKNIEYTLFVSPAC